MTRNGLVALSDCLSGRVCRALEERDGRDAFDYLVELCEKGLVRRYDKELPACAPPDMAQPCVSVPAKIYIFTT